MNNILMSVVGLFTILNLNIAKPMNEEAPIQPGGENTEEVLPETPETPEVPEVTFEEKTYTIEKDGNILTIVLTSETECEISMEVEGETKTLVGKYEINKKGRLILNVEGAGISEELVMNEDGTLTEYIYPCTVVYEESKYGDVLIDVTKGEPGEIVTIYAGAYPMFKVESIMVNDVILTAGEDKTYKFQLIEGENVIKANFVINSSEIGELMAIIKQYEDNNWENFFSLETLGILVSWLVTLLSSGGLGVMFLKSKKVKAKTEDKVMETVLSTLQDTNTKAINNFLKETFGPAFEKISSNLEVTDKTCTTLARCFILSQENTPEARLAIISELTNLQKTESSLADQVKAIVEAEVAKNNKVQEEKAATLAELKATNDAIEVKEKSSEGRY